MDSSKLGNKYVFLLLALLVIIVFLWFFKPIIVYLLVSSGLAFIGQPIVRLYTSIKIRSFKVSIGLAAFLTMLTLFLIVVALIAVFIPLMLEEATILANIDPKVVMSSFQEPIHQFENYVNRNNAAGSNDFLLNNYLEQRLSSVLGFAEITTVINDITGFMGDLVIAFFSISFMTFFFLKDEAMIRNVILLLVPLKHEQAVRNILDQTRQLLSRYFIGVCIDAIAVVLLVTLGLSLVGVPNALTIAFFAGIVNVIPYVGPLIAAAFGILIGISSKLSLDLYTHILPFVGKISLVFLAVQLIDGIILQPYIFSSRVKAHPLEIFLVVMVSGQFFGISGMIVAVPAYTILRVVAKEFLNNFRIVRRMTESLDKDK